MNKPFLHSTTDLTLVKLENSNFDNSRNVKLTNNPTSSISNLSETVLEQLAVDPNTPSALLEQLAVHPNPDVRAAVAENQNTSEECVLMLAKDRDPNVRYQIAENHRLSLDVLRLLAADENAYVAFRAQITLVRLQVD